MKQIFITGMSKASIPIIRLLLLTIMILAWAVSFSYGANDLLKMPSEESERAPLSILMDVVNVNGRIIAVGEWGHIIYSDDECSHWTQAAVPVAVTLTAVHFPTAQKGWAVGHDAVVLHTADGGKSWEKQLDGEKINQLMLDELKAMIEQKTRILKSSGDQMDNVQKETLRLELEDMDYFLSDLKAAVEEGPTRPLMDVWFENEQRGFIIGSFGMILETVDGGKNWAPLLDRIVNPEGFHYYGITRSKNNLFIAGEAGILFRSRDLGKTWQRLESPYEGSFFGITAGAAGDAVIAYGLRGNCFYSLDSGDSWKSSETGNQASLSGAMVASDGSFYAVGVDGVILKSTDQGKTFTALSQRFPGSTSIVEGNLDTAVVVGLKGVKRIELTD